MNRYLRVAVLALIALLLTGPPTGAGAASPHPKVVPTISVYDCTYGDLVPVTFTAPTPEASIRTSCRNEYGNVMWASEVQVLTSSPGVLFTSGWPTEAGTYADCTASILAANNLRKVIASDTYVIFSPITVSPAPEPPA
jgi:hypothetical protein